MNTQRAIDQYDRDGYVLLEDAVAPRSLAAVQASYEETIEAAMNLGLAERDEDTGFLGQYRFQNPHHPGIARYPLMEALAAPAVMDFVRALCGDDATMHGIAAFAMNPEYDYRGPWHRDSYFAWGKDSAFERRIREMKTFPATQILLALEEDASFWFVPGSHNRANTGEEEARFAEGPTAGDEMFPGAIQVHARAGSAVPFDAPRHPSRTQTPRRETPIPLHRVRHCGVNEEFGDQRLGSRAGVRRSPVSRVVASSVSRGRREDDAGPP